jgi:(S)-sulfolactate dehydrogenase
MKIVISEFMHGAAVELLREGFDVIYDPDLVGQPHALRHAVASADALIVRNRTRVEESLLSAGRVLKVIGRLGVGLDNIDLQRCRERHIEVIPATGANAQAVAEYVMATAMLLLRGAFAASAEVASGAWPRARLSQGREIAGKTLGLVGFGTIGQLTARLARGLGMDAIASDPALPDDASIWAETGVRPLPLDELVAHSDVVSLHVPLLPGTRNLFDGARIGRMKPRSLLINTSRGGIVDEPALASALREERLSGAALDVYRDEPLAADSALADVPNLILTPHIAGVTAESNVRVSHFIASQISAQLLR